MTEGSVVAMVAVAGTQLAILVDLTVTTPVALHRRIIVRILVYNLARSIGVLFSADRCKYYVA